MGIRKGMIEEEKKEEREVEGYIKDMVRMGEWKWRAIGVYINGDTEKKLQGLER